MAADASLTSLRYALESGATTAIFPNAPLPGIYGTPPTGTYKELRMVNEDLGSDIGMVTSEEIVSDRAPPDNIQTEAGASGNHVSELTGGSGASVTYDDMWLGAFGATGFSTVQSTPVSTMSGTITPTNSGNNLTLTLSTGTWNALFVAGEFLVLAGFTGVRAVLNSVFRVVSGAGTAALVLDSGVLAPASPGTENAALVSAALCRSITPGSVFRSWALERKYSLPSDYAVEAGMVLSGFDVELRPKRPLKVTFRWIGRKELSFASTRALTNETCTITAASTAATAGNFTLTVNGQTTANIAFNATAAAVQAALELLSTVGVGNVTCVATTGANLGVNNAVVTITFHSALGGTNLTTSATMGGLTGNPHVFAVTLQGGSDALIPAVTSTRVFSSVSDVKMFAINKNGSAFFINSLTLRFKNGAYMQDEQAGTLGPINIGQGSFSLDGSMEFYYIGSTLFDIAQAFTDTEIAFAASNSSGNTWGLHVPRVNFKTPRRATPGKDQATKGTLEFQAAKGAAFLTKLFLL
jgi:hypothetical protein